MRMNKYIKIGQKPMKFKNRRPFLLNGNATRRNNVVIAFDLPTSGNLNVYNDR